MTRTERIVVYVSVCVCVCVCGNDLHPPLEGLADLGSQILLLYLLSL